MKLEVEELKQRILPSASPGNPESEPEPRIAKIVQQAVQVIDTVENEVVSLEKVETQEIAQAKANLLQDWENLENAIFNPQTSPQISLNSAAGSGSGRGAATTAHNASSQQPSLVLQQTGHGSGSGAATTAHENKPANGAIKPMVGPDAGSGSGSNQSPDATVEGQVWLDNNGNGKLDNNELGFSGIKVELDVEGQGWFYTTTDDAQTGVNYSFPVYVPEGTTIDYQITVVIPPNDWATIQGTNSVINSNGESPIYTLAPGDVANVPAGLRSMNVTTVQDDAAAPIQNQITLRDAIQTGNNGPPVPSVTFQGGLSETISLQAGLPAIQKNYDIDGPGASTITVQGNGNAGNPYRIFTINTGVNTAISDLTIRGGFVQNANGGGILNNGSLTLFGDTVTKNTATDAGSGGGAGGGIYNSKSAYLELNTVGINYNNAGGGGGIYNSGNVLINDSSTITFNTASAGGGGIENWGGSITAKNNTSINFNKDTGVGGGGVFNRGGTFVMNQGGTILINIETSLNGGGLANVWGGTVTLTGIHIAGNNAKSPGGGIYAGTGKMMLNSVSIGTKNDAPSGGGMYINGGTVKMSMGGIYTNTATSPLGGFNKQGGGGLYINSGSLTLTKVSIGANTAKGNGGGMYVGGGTVDMAGGSMIGNGISGNSNGGGIYVSSGILSLMGNLTVQKNRVVAGGTGNGGGMYINGGTVYITSPTVGHANTSSLGIENNGAPNNGGGIYIYAGSLTFKGNTTGVENNSAGKQGGGLYLGKNSSTNFAAPSTLVKLNTAAGARQGVYLQNFATVLNLKNLNDGDDQGGIPIKGP